MNHESKNIFDTIIKSRRKNLFVFTFGASGMGKSSLLTYLFHQIKQRYGFMENLNDGYSSKLFQDYIQNFEMYGELPQETTNLKSLIGTPFQYVDVTIDSPSDNIEQTSITFLEFAGEDIESLDKDFIFKLDKYKARFEERPVVKEEPAPPPRRGMSVRTQNRREPQKTEEKPAEAPSINGTGYKPGEAVKFTENLDKLLTHPNIYVMCFMVASAQYAKVEDFLISKFVSLIKQNPRYLSRLISANLIVSKWDMANLPDEEIENFTKENLGNSYNLLSRARENGLPFNLLPFSVGQIDPNNVLSVVEPDMSYAAAILDLIENHIKKPERKVQQEVPEEAPVVKKKPKKRKVGFRKYW